MHIFKLRATLQLSLIFSLIVVLGSVAVNLEPFGWTNTLQLCCAPRALP